MIKIIKKNFSATLVLIFFLIISFSLISIKIFEKNKKFFLNKYSINVSLITSVHPSLIWSFEPLKNKIKIKPGEVNTVEYMVKNLGNTETTGVAVFDYYPNEFQPYFTKINCFCYDLKTLKSGEQDKYSMVFFLDPEVTKDNKTKNIKEAIIQFTFFSKEEFNKSKN